jgi:hypothetical protein
VPKGYIDQLGAFQYKGRTIEAHVVKPATARKKNREGPRRSRAIWTVTVDSDQFGLFPASPDDTEEQVRERIKRWVDEHMPRTTQGEATP